MKKLTQLSVLLLSMPLLITQFALAQTARVQIVHNSPYAEAAVVDIYVNEMRALDNVEFRDVTEFLSLPAGVPVTIDVTAGDASDNSAPVFTLNLDSGLEDGATLLAIAAGDPLARPGNPAFDIFISEVRESAETAGNVEFLVFHGSPDAPTVDVVERTAGTLVDDISFGEFTDNYLSVPPAVYDLDIQTADNSATAASFRADLTGAADAAIAVLASGFLQPTTADDPGFGLLAVFADGSSALLPAIDPPQPQTALVQIVHNSPYAEAALVDVYVNDERALDDVAFRDATPFLDLPAETPVKIDVTAGDAADNASPVFTLDGAVLPADATLLIVAAGDPLARAGNPAFDLFITEARESAETAGNVEFVVFHGSPDAPTVDVVERTAGTLVDDISFGEFTDDYLSVPPANYELDVQTADNSATAASFAADLSGAADAAIAVLASGFLAPAEMADPSFGLLAVFADGTTALLPAIDPPGPASARVQIVHNSPYSEAALVDVYVNDERALDDVAFRDATPFLDLPAETPVKIDVTAGDAADNASPVFTLDGAVLPADATLLIVAAGDPLARAGNPAFDLFITEARESAETAGNVEFVVFHGSPDAPTVDVLARGAGILVDDVSFGEFSQGYISVPPARYEVDVETGDNSVTAASFVADLTDAADAAVSVLASGFLAPASENAPGFGLLAVFPDGTTALLPANEQSITFTLIDASTDMPVQAFDPLPQDAVLDLSAIPAQLNIRANLQEEAHSVVFGHNDNRVLNTESFEPYAFCGDIEGDYFDCHLPLGEHVITATSYTGNAGTGSQIASETIAFTIINNGNAVTDFVLVDAETDEDLMVLEDGMTIDLGALPAHLNVRANVGNKVKSVHFELSPTPFSRLENVAPYALFGDIEGDYFGGSFGEGENTIQATPYTRVSAEGDEGNALSITFNVTGHHPDAPGIPTGDHTEDEASGSSPITLSAADDNRATPARFQLESNYPNPFNPTTTIAFSLPESSVVRLAVYDMLGRQVRILVDGNVQAGRTEVVFDAGNLPTGTYLYRLSTPRETIVKKMLLVK